MLTFLSYMLCTSKIYPFSLGSYSLCFNTKLRFTKSAGLRSFFAFLAQNCVRCIVLTKRFPVS
jgi:hypothetical protein